MFSGVGIDKLSEYSNTFSLDITA